MTTQEPTLLHLPRQALNQQEYLGRLAQEGDCTRLITQPTLVYDDDERRVVLAYLLMDEDMSDLAAALQGVPTPKHQRMSGLKTQATTFGYEPRNATRQDYCTAAVLAARHPQAYALLTQAAVTVARAYAWYDPDRYAQHSEQTERVLPEWRVAETVFTSGILNRDSALAYHFDRGNVAGVWSGMLGFKRDMLGGYLAIPAYDLALEIADQSLTLFDGQSLVHGVTPLQPLSLDAYRLTAVYYARKGMWRCLTNPEEVAAFQERRTERERRHADT